MFSTYWLSVCLMISYRKPLQTLKSQGQHFIYLFTFFSIERIIQIAKCPLVWLTHNLYFWINNSWRMNKLEFAFKRVLKTQQLNKWTVAEQHKGCISNKLKRVLNWIFKLCIYFIYLFTYWLIHYIYLLIVQQMHFFWFWQLSGAMAIDVFMSSRHSCPANGLDLMVAVRG